VASRRDFVRQAAFAAVPVVLTARLRQEPIKPVGRAAADTLAVPLDRNANPMGPLDNDPTVIGIERRLGCACGCTLDVYTCRTTDFSCTYSPAMHAKVVAQRQAGRTPEEITQWFLDQPDSVFGHKVLLMAPKARGFNLLGYIVPGLTVAAFGLALAAWLLRRKPVAVAPEPAGTAATPAPDSEQMARLQHALDDVES
jgi:hypothetical protein